MTRNHFFVAFHLARRNFLKRSPCSPLPSSPVLGDGIVLEQVETFLKSHTGAVSISDQIFSGRGEVSAKELLRVQVSMGRCVEGGHGSV